MSSSPELSAASGLAAARPELTAGDWKRLNLLLAQALECIRASGRMVRDEFLSRPRPAPC